MEKETMTVNEFAEHLGVTTRTIYRRIKVDPRYPKPQRIRSVSVVFKEDVDVLIQKLRADTKQEDNAK